MSRVLQEFRTGSRAPGVYRFVGRVTTGRLLTAATRWGWQGVHFDGKMISDKQTFLIEGGKALRFPAYFGQNWDAFEEMINDLSWLPASGYLVVYTHVHHFAAQHPSAWTTAREILQTAARSWQAEGIPFVVLLRQTQQTNLDLPWCIAL